jgi:glutamate-1-semialdehyde 2,1-aminomutase
MTSLKAARAFTGREKMAKVEGAYHGSYDYAEVSQTATPAQWGPAATPTSVPVARGTPRGALADVVVIPFNDPERALALLEPHRDELACVLLDPMPHRVGLSPADQEFVRVLRDWTERHGALLVFDEVITLRATYGGAQQWYDVVPDLTALGKIIGGGFPVGAVTGRADVMNVMDPRTKPLLLPHSGTFSGNPVSMTAGLVAMEHFGPDAVARLNRLADRAVTGIREAIDATGARACVTGGGSMFRVHLKEQAPANYREAYLDEAEKRRLNVLLDHLFGAGMIMINTCSATISTAMGEAEVDALVDAVRTGLEAVGRLE